MFDLQATLAVVDHRGMDRATLAAAAGVDQGRLSKWLRGVETPGPSKLVALARALQVEPSLLFWVPDTERTIAYWRTIAGHSLVTLSEVVGISATQISRIERGRSQLSPTLAQKLSEALGVDVATLMEASERARKHSRTVVSGSNPQRLGAHSKAAQKTTTAA